MADALAVYMGRDAAERISRDGWRPEHFSLLLGASGGAKWLILAHLDRFLFGDYLQRSDQPLSTLGSSIGTWRHACLAMPNPLAAIDAMEQGYIYQRYARKPSAEEVSQVSSGILANILGEDGARHLVEHPRIRTHIVTARGRGPSASSATPLLAAGMGAAALSNGISRRLLQWHFQRVVFHSGAQPRPVLDLPGFATHYAPLTAQTLQNSLHASGAIPFVLTGERDIPGAPRGQYWDGGIIDYHFDLAHHNDQGLVLYPHFGANIIPGWFDKMLNGRHTPMAGLSRLVLLCPDKAFIENLPHSKIPDRKDFRLLKEDDRIRYWEECVARGRALADEFQALIAGSDPLAGVTVLD